jgi:hypothetical protein
MEGYLMSNIHSNDEAYEAIVDGLNYLTEQRELFDVGVMGYSFRLAFDIDAGKWYVEKFTPKVKEQD